MKYMDSARNCEVLVDGESVNAAQHCRDLEAELKWLKNQHVRVCSSESGLKQQLAEQTAKIERVRHLILHHKYDHGRFPFDSMMTALKEQDK